MSLALIIAWTLFAISLASFVFFVAACQQSGAADDNDDALAERLMRGDPRLSELLNVSSFHDPSL